MVDAILNNLRIYFITGLLILGVTVLGIRCKNIKRSNPLDPANPKSARSQVALVEAFINDSTPFSPFALSALNEIAAQTKEEQALFLEYHLPSPSYPDSLAISANKARYDYYTNQDQAVPDVFFNGMRYRVQGAASKGTALERYQTALTREREAVSYFTIEADLRISNNTLSVDVSIARLGQDDFADFFLQAVAFEDIGTGGHHFVVREVLPSETIHQIDAGERKDVTLSTVISAVAKPQRWQVVVFIQQNSNKEILQSTLAD